MDNLAAAPSVLIIYYSLSGQTRCLVHRLALGLQDEGVHVVEERLHPVQPIRFPIGTIPATIKMMVATFLRKRIPIEVITPACSGDYNLIVLAGPTWSYNPSGPVLSLLDGEGRKLFQGKNVLPLISCRGYWRAHWWGLRRLLLKMGATVPNVMVFPHPCPEPWRTIGVFLKLAGKSPEKHIIIGKYYKRYGHSRQQQEEAYQFGRTIGKLIITNKLISGYHFVSTVVCDSCRME